MEKITINWMSLKSFANEDLKEYPRILRKYKLSFCWEFSLETLINDNIEKFKNSSKITI